MKYHAIISEEGDWVVALCPELDVASEGKTVEEAVKNLKEAVELYLEDEDSKSLPIKKIKAFLNSAKASSESSNSPKESRNDDSWSN